MYLKNITLRGFKSFANKSQLIFEPGISVIVGPNGSGKSNIVDAISWVLGEQSAKSLRGSSMEDIIFKSKKEEYAIAEVSLIFDNSDRFFPMEFNEVKFTRRVYQKGGSEYFINSSPARLIDIQDLTSEKGIGKGLYTIINQGQIDDIALFKPEERKLVIDEILGIEKHKIRKEKSKIKLQKVTADIERIEDLMQEIKRTLDPLEIESAKAQRYFEIFNRLKQEEIALFISEINNLNKAWTNENFQYEQAVKERKEAIFSLKQLENKKLEFEEKFSQQQKQFNIFKKSIDNLNLINNNLISLISITESKKNVFNTLKNIFKVEQENIKRAIPELVTNFENRDKKLGIKTNENIILKNLEDYLLIVKDIEEKVNNFLQRLEDYVKDKEVSLEYKKDTELIKKNIRKLKDLIGEEIKQLRVFSNLELSEKVDIEGIKDTKEEIDRQLELIEGVKDYCDKLVILSENLYILMKRLEDVYKKIFLKGYPDFERLQTEINNYNLRINNFLKDIQEANLKIQSFDNQIYRIEIRKEQIKERVKKLTEEVLDNYNLSMEYILKNYKPSENIEQSKKTIRKLKDELKNFGTINPNATIEFKKLKERYDFLDEQKTDLLDSKKQLEGLIKEIDERIENIFNSKFEEINLNFNNFFKALFPLGNGYMSLIKIQKENENNYGIELNVDIGNDKMIPLSLLSGGEKALVSIAFLFSIFAVNHSPFYVFDEIDASLDDVNLDRFLALVKKFSEGRQTILITHQKKTMGIAETIYGVSMQSSGISKIISKKVSKEDAKVN